MKKLLSIILVALFAVTLSACNGEEEIPEDVINCVTNPDAEECIDDTGDNDDDPVDDKTAEEIAADQVLATWEGDLEHLSILMNEMEMDNSYEIVTNFEFEMEVEGETVYVYQSSTDQYLMVEDYQVMSRTIDTNIDGEITSVQVIYEEVATGVVVYVDMSSIRDMITEDYMVANGALATLGFEGDWVAFHFDDSLENVIELEVLRDMMYDVVLGEFGDTYFTDMQTMIETNLGFALDPYGVDFELFIDYLMAENYTAAETMIQNIDLQGMILQFDSLYVAPEIVALLQTFEVELSNAGLDITPHVLELQTNGTESFFNNATDAEISILLDVLVDAQNQDPNAPDFSDLYDQYAAGSLQNYVMMVVLNDPNVEMMLTEVMGEIYFNDLYTTMETLDFDALYAELELFNEVLVAQLFNSIYEGQTAYQSYISLLESMLPETAKLLAPFEGVVIRLEPVFMDVDYLLNNKDAVTQFLDLNYYMENEMMDVTVEKTEDFEIETSMTMGANSYLQLFNDVLNEVYMYMDGMDAIMMPYVENINCPEGETCQPFTEYTEIIAALNSLEAMDMTAIFDPSNPSEVLFNMDFAALMNSVIALDETAADNPVQTMALNITMKDNTDITIPTETANANDIANDFAKFSLLTEAYDYLHDIVLYDERNPGFETGTFDLGQFAGIVYPSLAFRSSDDALNSFVIVSGTESNPEYAIQLVYRDGTNVFTEALDYDYLMSLSGETAPSRSDYETAIAYVDDANFNMTKLFLIYLLQDDSYKVGTY